MVSTVSKYHKVLYAHTVRTINGTVLLMSCLLSHLNWFTRGQMETTNKDQNNINLLQINPSSTR